MKIIKKHIHGKESRQKMLDGIMEGVAVIGSTMGGKGRNVIVDKEFGSPLIVNDGATCLNEVFFDEPLKNLSIQLVKDAANRTNATCGDGTTGCTVLSGAIVKAGWESVESGSNPVILRKELEKAAEKIEENLKQQADKIETKEQAISIAKISVQDDELGVKIGSLMFEVGSNGAVSIKNSLERGVFIEKDGGMRLEGQLVGGMVENENKWETKLDKPKVLILKDSPEDHEFETKWIPLMRQFIESQALPNGETKVKQVNVPVLLIVAEKLSRRFIMTMNQNVNMLKWVWFRPTTAGKNMKEIYKDLQSMVGGKVVSEEEGVFLSKFTLEDFGKADMASITRHECIITVSPEQLSSDEYLDRIEAVKGQIENAEDEVEQRDIKDRYANLTKGVAAIKVMSATEQDTTELKLRIEDAINATRAAMEEGYVAGGGVALFNASKCLKGETNGEKVLKQSCEACIRQIFHNAGYENPDKLLSELKDGEGVDVLSDKKVDMKKAGIVDPLKVIRYSLINAVSVSGLLLTSEYVIVNVEENDVQTLKRIFTKKD